MRGRGLNFRQAGRYLSVVEYRGLRLRQVGGNFSIVKYGGLNRLELRQVSSNLSIVKYRGFRLRLVFYSSLELLYLLSMLFLALIQNITRGGVTMFNLTD